MTSVWDDPSLKISSDFVKFEHPGETVTGKIVDIRRHQWEDGSVAPQLFLQLADGTEKTLTAGQLGLKAALTEQRPEPGDTVTITFVGVESRTGGRTLKKWKLDVTRAGSPMTVGPVAAPAPAPAAAPTPPPAAPPAPGGMSAEQTQALKAAGLL